MAIDTFFAYSGVYATVEDALADYDAIHALHTELGLIDAYDAAVVKRDDTGKVKIVKKQAASSWSPEAGARSSALWPATPPPG
jgi:uncharacterized membrane protein